MTRSIPATQSLSSHARMEETTDRHSLWVFFFLTLVQQARGSTGDGTWGFECKSTCPPPPDPPLTVLPSPLTGTARRRQRCAHTGDQCDTTHANAVPSNQPKTLASRASRDREPREWPSLILGGRRRVSGVFDSVVVVLFSLSARANSLFSPRPAGLAGPTIHKVQARGEPPPWPASSSDDTPTRLLLLDRIAHTFDRSATRVRTQPTGFVRQSPDVVVDGSPASGDRLPPHHLRPPAGSITASLYVRQCCLLIPLTESRARRP